jgi:CRP/FNR family cyclic AMP-dependent transcriptional regulator
VRESGAMSRSRYLESLRNVAMFSGCTKKQLDHVARVMTELVIPAGNTFIHESSLAHEFMVIEQGTATVRRNGRKIAQLGPGDVVGELALILHRPRSASVTADTDLTVLVVDARSFEPLLDEVPGLARRLLTTVAERLSEAAKPSAIIH